MESGITKRLIQEGILVREGGKHSVASVKTVIAENNQEFVSRLKDIHDALQKKTAFIEDIFQLNEDLSFDKIKRTPEKVEPTPVPVEETIEVEEDIQSEIDEETDEEERKLRLRMRRIISRLIRKKKKPPPKPKGDKTGRVTRYSDDARAKRTAANRTVRLTTTGPRSRGKVTGLAKRLAKAPKVFNVNVGPVMRPVDIGTTPKAPSPVSRPVTTTSPKPGPLPATSFDKTPVANTDSGRNRFVAEKLIKEAEDLAKKFEGRRIPPDVLIKIQAKIDTANNFLRTATGLTTSATAEAPKPPSVFDDADVRKAELEKQKRLDAIQKANEQLEKQRAADEADPRAGHYDMQESKVRGKMLGNSLKPVLGGSLKVGGKLLVVLSVLGPLAGRNKVVDDTLKSIPITGTDFTLFDIANDPRAQETNMPFLVELGKDVVTAPTDFIDLFTTLSAWAINKGFGTELSGASFTENLINGPYYQLLAKNAEFIGAYRGKPEAKKIMDGIMTSLESMSIKEIRSLDELTVLRIETLGSPNQRLKFYKLRKEARETLELYELGYFIDDTLDARAERTRGEIEVPEEPGFFQRLRRLFLGSPTVEEQPGSVSGRDVPDNNITNITTDPSDSLRQ